MNDDKYIYVNLDCQPDIKHENYVNMIKNVCKSEKKSRQQEFENEVDYLLQSYDFLSEDEYYQNIQRFKEKWSPK